MLLPFFRINSDKITPPRNPNLKPERAAGGVLLHRNTFIRHKFNDFGFPDACNRFLRESILKNSAKNYIEEF